MSDSILPSQEYCRNLHDIYAVPKRVRDHCEAVVVVGDVLVENGLGEVVDDALLNRLALVHDSFKVGSLSLNDFAKEPFSVDELGAWRYLRTNYGHLHEVDTAAAILAEDFPEFSKLVSMIGSTANPRYLGEEVPFDVQVSHYADWRVQGSGIMSFDDRLDYLQRRYFKGDQATWEARLEQERAIETAIFEHLNFNPDELADKVREFKAK